MINESVGARPGRWLYRVLAIVVVTTIAVALVVLAVRRQDSAPAVVRAAAKAMSAGDRTAFAALFCAERRSRAAGELPEAVGPTSVVAVRIVGRTSAAATIRLRRAHQDFFLLLLRHTGWCLYGVVPCLLNRDGSLRDAIAQNLLVCRTRPGR